MVAINFKNALENDERALYLRTQRAEVLANNLANVDTPNFKARDINFAELLQQSEDSMQEAPKTKADQLKRTDEYHLSKTSGGNLLYRIPSQPAIDGNTVEEHAEMARFAKNAIDFEVSLNFLNDSLKGLQSALRGTKV